jgi:hypothetical protein
LGGEWTGKWDDFGTYKFTADHFEKTLYNRMRVYFAVQINSQSMIRMINNYARHCRGGLEAYAPMKKMPVIIDKRVNIMNGNKKNGCNNIHTPTQIHLHQLLDELKGFHKWKKNCEEKEHFIPKSTYKDLCCMVFAVVGVEKTYLKNDKSFIMLQKNSDTDVCEQHFGNICSRGPKASLEQARHHAAHATAIDSNTFGNFSKLNTSGAI